MKTLYKLILATLFLLPLLLSNKTTVAQTTPIRFAVVGDFGHEQSGMAVQIANLIDSWNVDFIITTGDNTYYLSDQHDRGSGQFYHEYIFPYTGIYGSGSPTGANRFFPVLGNHDWDAGINSYEQFFTLPETLTRPNDTVSHERFYTFIRGPVQFFMIDSDSREPEGNTSNSPQAVWLQNALAASTSVWKIVVFHHPPFSSGNVHGGSPTRNWPYAEWGANAVLSGHEHLYERLFCNGIPYFVNGSGGRSLYGFSLTPVPCSQVRYNTEYGAQLVTADENTINFQFINRLGVVIDTLTLSSQITSTATIGPTITITPTITRTPTRTPTSAIPTNTFTPSVNPNLALNRPVLVSSVDNSLRQGDKSVDGNYSTRWSSNYTNNQWIQVDLGNIVNVSQIILTWEIAYGKSYRIETSNDGINWTTIFTTTSGNGGTDDILVNGSGRYVRMFGVEKATQYGFSLWEFEIYGVPASTPTPTLTHTSTTTVTPTSTPTRTPTLTPTPINTVTATIVPTATRSFIDRWFCDGVIEIDGNQITCYSR